MMLQFIYTWLDIDLCFVLTGSQESKHVVETVQSTVGGYRYTLYVYFVLTGSQESKHVVETVQFTVGGYRYTLYVYFVLTGSQESKHVVETVQSTVGGICPGRPETTVPQRQGV